MYDLATIKSMNAERAREARKAGKQPFLITSQDQIDSMPPFPFPNIGSMRVTGWRKVATHFVDKSGTGSENEPALTAEQFKRKLRVGHAYAITEEGQFQLYVTEYVKVKP